MMEPFLKAADTGAEFDCSNRFQPFQGQADIDSAKQSQHQGCIGVANPALVLVHGDIQRVVQAALNNPIAAFELKETFFIKFFERQATDQIIDFRGFFTLAANSAP